MATLCKNCGYPLVFDPLTKNVVCDACGSAFRAEGIESYGKEYAEGPTPIDPVTGQPVAGGAVREFMECHVYTCSSCGGEMIISGTEVSTTCIYCGSANVIFSRISKEKQPDFIMPFQFTREQATEIIRQKCGRGLFVPKEFKELKPESVQGIYIPYWLVDVYHAESDIISGKVGSGDSSTTYYYARSGRMKINNMLVEASMELDDSTSRLLEPYDLRKLRVFDEEYMLGFYSDMSDLTYGELRRIADFRATDVFRRSMYKDISAHSCRVVDGQSATLIDKDLKYALLPAWFVTVQYEGKPHTILVNGETGKVVCGLPWSKKLFWSLVGLVGGIIGLFLAIIYFVIGMFFTAGFGSFGDFTVITAFIPVIAPVLIVSLIFFLIGYLFYSKVKRQIEKTQSTDTFNFARKRQG